MSRITVADVDEAVAEANRRLSTGRRLWFRGQTRDWPLRSSFARLSTEGQASARQRAETFKSWIDVTPGLEALAANSDYTIAVAQHHGLATNFVDFTTDPEIAGFFATQKLSANADDEHGCIICLDVDEFTEFWRFVGDTMRTPELLELDVPNLWRLEAQKGRFIYLPHTNVEYIFDFDRILFPRLKSVDSVSKVTVYPARKSNLEILLDQYFMKEQLQDSRQDWRGSNFSTFEIEESPDGCDPVVFPNGLPVLESWSDASLHDWLHPKPERLAEAQSSLAFRASISCSETGTALMTLIASEIEQRLLSLPNIRTKLVSWSIEVSVPLRLPVDFSLRIAPSLTMLWDGLRSLPYSDKDVCYGLAMCVTMAIELQGELRQGDRESWRRAAANCLSDPVEVEFGSDDTSYSRSYVSREELKRAVREDLLEHLAPEERKRVKEIESSVFIYSRTPRRTFDFIRFAPVFAREIAPIQVLSRSGALFYSPARIDRLGLP